MRILYASIVGFALALSATAQAQLPFPFQPEPDFTNRPQCTKDYVRSVESLATALEKLRTGGPDALGRLCTLVEMGSAWLGGDLPADIRRELRGLLGVDVDLKHMTEQCRAGQDGIARELTIKLQQLRAELVRCEDTI
jgi:hypothetical protein